MKKKLIRRAFADTIPVLTGYVVLGIGFGILMSAAGFGAWHTLAMSALIYAGSLQYLAVGMLSGGVSLAALALTSLMVNARHLFYGISMVEKYRGAGWRKGYIIFALTDETYSLVCKTPDGIDEAQRHDYYFLVSLMDHFYWVAGSLLGSLCGELITVSTEGVDFALTALFLTVLTDQWLKSKNHFAALTGLLASVACLLIFGRDGFLIPAMAVITAVLLAGKKFTGGAENE